MVCEMSSSVEMELARISKNMRHSPNLNVADAGQFRIMLAL
jgi:hypothetical protein